MVKTIRKLACEEFLAAKDTKREAQKPSKGFIYVYVLFNGTLLINYANKTFHLRPV